MQQKGIKRKDNALETRGSSLFRELSWSNGTLTVEMVGYAKYIYKQVPKDVWLRFKNAASYGHFYNTYIKGVYQFERVS